GLVGALAEVACLPAGDIVLVVDAPRPQVYDPGALAAVQSSYFVMMRNRIIANARARGFKVVDTEPYFIAAYAADHRRFEHPTDGHLNAPGPQGAPAAWAHALSRP